MKKINNFFCLLLAAVSFSYGQIDISGIVRDSKTNEPVEGATVKLTGCDSITVTDKSGKFKIFGTSVLKQFRYKSNSNGPVVAGKDIFYHHETDGAVQIQVFNLSGKEIASVFSGSLGAGTWRIPSPQLSPGTYFYTFRTKNSYNVVRCLSLESGGVNRSESLKKVSDLSSVKSGTMAKRMELAVDSLVVEKSGYRSAYLPLDSYFQHDLEILLEDTTSSFSDDMVIIPDKSWDCFMPDGIPSPKNGERVFSLKLELSDIHDVGVTQFGHRRQFDIKGGTITGDRINGTVVTGGLEYELTLSNGSVELEQIVILKVDNVHVLMRNAGVAPAGAKNVRVVLDFEAPSSSSCAWLNSGHYVAERIVDTAAKTVTLDVSDVSDAATSKNSVQIKDPEGVPNQSWDCVTYTGTKGAEVFTENVALGSSISIGNSKRGSRNIIPITGGTTKGRVNGKILPGGADYQLNGLDARYTLAPDNGELIIVRNCGAGTLYPVFETRVDGEFAFLND
ncbi:MAG: DUF3237 family protein, partial [Fibrobacter sp.]|nr:DUF3237 family protein [Fibrobacter sp.]